MSWKEKEDCCCGDSKEIQDSKRQESDAEETKTGAGAPEQSERWAGEAFVCGTNTTRCCHHGRRRLLVCAFWLVSLSVCLSALKEPIATGSVCPCDRGHENGSIFGAEDDANDDDVAADEDVAVAVVVVEVECGIGTVVAVELVFEIVQEGCEAEVVFVFVFGWGR